MRLAVALVLVGCASEPDPVVCRDCVEDRWWVRAASDCAPVCSALPSLAQCEHADCNIAEARRYSGDTEAFVGVVHSASARSFYVMAAPTTRAFAMQPSCLLLAGSTGYEATCNGDTLVLPHATYTAAPAPLAAALDDVSVTGSYRY